MDSSAMLWLQVVQTILTAIGVIVGILQLMRR